MGFVPQDCMLFEGTVFSNIALGDPQADSKSVVEAAKIGSDMNEENSTGIVVDESSDALDVSKTIAAPDLGDDQAFPFIPGFGKNSGKD